VVQAATKTQERTTRPAATDTLAGFLISYLQKQRIDAITTDHYTQIFQKPSNDKTQSPR
jgi:hypothetical protein